MSDMFKYFGISYYKDEYKVRFANAASRVKVLERAGHTDVRFVELVEPMNKVDGIAFIRDLEIFQDAAAQSAIADFLDNAETKAAKADKVKIPGAGRAKRVTGEGIDPSDDILAMARAVAEKDKELVTVDDEDTPF